MDAAHRTRQTDNFAFQYLKRLRCQDSGRGCSLKDIAIVTEQLMHGLRFCDNQRTSEYFRKEKINTSS